MTIFAIAISCFLLGILATVATGILIERRVYARPTARLEVAAQLLRDQSREIGGGR